MCLLKLRKLNGLGFVMLGLLGRLVDSSQVGGKNPRHNSQVTKVTWVTYQTLPRSPELSETRANVISHDNFIPEDSSMRKYVVSICAMLLAGCAFAQQDTPAVEPMAKTPVFRVKVVSRTTKAVNYRHRGGSTMVDFKGTSLMPEASGKGKVDSKAGRLEISADFAHLAPASKFGAQYLTYVLWAVTPEGRSVNLGEVVPNSDGKNSLDVTTDLQAFGLVITAEPYFAVTRPSNLVVVENIVRQETKEFEASIDTR